MKIHKEESDSDSLINMCNNIKLRYSSPGLKNWFNDSGELNMVGGGKEGVLSVAVTTLSKCSSRRSSHRNRCLK